ncbi:MAG: hypothetical protein V2I33_12240 [Kangiellaceae bacterium]|jgi:hypothetical protein|nr:hypothetical protein [Kangiellaceae bacterium]
MFYISLSIVALASAPLIERVFREQPNFDKVLSGFLLAVLGGIIFIDLLPFSFNVGGWPVLVFAGFGLLGPSLIEKAFRKAADSTHQLTLIIGICGLLLHTMLDGAGLNEYSNVGSHDSWLPLAIVLHRVPVALTILWVVRPVFGLKAVWMALFALAVFTLFGYVLGVQIEQAMTTNGYAWLQAFVSGTLLHVLIHRPHRHHHEEHHAHSHSIFEQFKSWRHYQLIGLCIGFVVLALLHLIHH